MHLQSHWHYVFLLDTKNIKGWFAAAKKLFCVNYMNAYCCNLCYRYEHFFLLMCCMQLAIICDSFFLCCISMPKLVCTCWAGSSKNQSITQARAKLHNCLKFGSFVMLLLAWPAKNNFIKNFDSLILGTKIFSML